MVVVCKSFLNNYLLNSLPFHQRRSHRGDHIGPLTESLGMANQNQVGMQHSGRQSKAASWLCICYFLSHDIVGVIMAPLAASLPFIKLLYVPISQVLHKITFVHKLK